MRFSVVRDTAVAIAVVVSTGFWLAHLRFYDELGIAPADVGIGVGVILERSVGAVIVILLLAPVVAVLVLEIVVLGITFLGRRRAPIEQLGRIERRSVARLREGEWKITPWPPIAMLGTFLVWVLAENLVTAVGFGVSVAAALVAVRGLVVITGGLVVKGFVVAVAGLSALAAFGWFWNDAGNAARAARDGLRVERETYGLSASAYRAIPAYVRLDGRRRCMLYLGASDGGVLVYDPRHKIVERLPTGNTRITLNPDMPRCR